MGLRSYLLDWWNFLDMVILSLYLAAFTLRSSWPGLHTSTARMPLMGCLPLLHSAGECPQRSPDSLVPSLSLALSLSLFPRHRAEEGARRTPSSWLRCLLLSPACSASHPPGPPSCRPMSRWAPQISMGRMIDDMIRCVPCSEHPPSDGPHLTSF